jgi:hypothetical protein
VIAAEITASVSATDAALTPVAATETAIGSIRMPFSSVDCFPRISYVVLPRISYAGESKRFPVLVWASRTP